MGVKALAHMGSYEFFGKYARLYKNCVHEVKSNTLSRFWHCEML